MLVQAHTHAYAMNKQSAVYILDICLFLSSQTCAKILEFMERIDWNPSQILNPHYLK